MMELGILSAIIMEQFTPIKFPLEYIKLPEIPLTSKNFRKENRLFYYNIFIKTKRKYDDVLSQLKMFYDIVEEKSDTKELRQFKVVNNPKSTDIYHISSLKNGQIESFHYDYISDLFYSSNPLLQSILSYLQGVDIGDKEKEELYAENIYSINIFYTILKAKEMFKKLSVSRDCLVISYKHKAIRLPNTVFNNYINQHLSYVNHHNENKSRWNYKIVLRGHHNNYITIYDRLIVYDDTAIFDDNRLTALNEYLDIISKI